MTLEQTYVGDPYVFSHVNADSLGYSENNAGHWENVGESNLREAPMGFVETDTANLLHLALTYNMNRQITLYRNGAVCVQTFHWTHTSGHSFCCVSLKIYGQFTSATPIITYGLQARIEIGWASAAPGGYPVDANVYDARLYDTALDFQQIYSLYQSTKSPYIR